MSIPDPKIALWEAINQYAISVGGDPSARVHGNTPRMEAVAAVETAVATIAASTRLDDAMAVALLGSKALQHPGFEAFRRQFHQRSSLQTAFKTAWQSFQAGWEGE